MEQMRESFSSSPFLFGGKFASFLEISFFWRGLCFNLKFSRIALFRKLLHLDFKTDLITNGYILCFSARMCLVSLSSSLHGPKVA